MRMMPVMLLFPDPLLQMKRRSQSLNQRLLINRLTRFIDDDLEVTLQIRHDARQRAAEFAIKFSWT